MGWALKSAAFWRVRARRSSSRMWWKDEGRQVEAEIAESGGDAVFMRPGCYGRRQLERGRPPIRSRATANLDILVNNAGISGTHHPDTMSTEAWDTFMEINAKGVFLGMKCAIPAMKNAGGGSIVNISSISGFVGQQGNHMGYNASKGAVRIVTKSAAVQYAQDGIRVNSVHPGVMPPMRSSSAARNPDAPSPLLDHVPMGRVGLTSEVGNAVLFLASDEASYITGAELVVDGGLTAT